ncbi:MAG: ABC transporter substrate-binding protein [Minisyncoccota bacterium]
MTYRELRVLLTKRFALPQERTIHTAIRSFTLAEKTVFYFLVGIFILSSITLLSRVNSSFLVTIPVRGGTLIEGVVGTPRFINPVLAFSDADKSLSVLVYSGLVRHSPDGNGEVINDLADNISISKDQLTYTAHIRSDAIFQDGSRVTADDVLFTIQKIQNGSLKSPLFGDWSGVLVEKIDDETISFNLKKPYAPFISNLTVGILPKHIWKNVTDDEFSFSQFNVLPVGSGPYKIKTVERNSGGIPNYYHLETFTGVVGDVPFIENLIFRFYSNQTDLLNAHGAGDIESMAGISALEASDLKKSGTNIVSSPLSRIFGVFFNQGRSKPLLEKAVRQALDLSAPKEEIVAKVLQGYGSPIDGPFPAGLFSWSGDRRLDTDYAARFESAQNILKKAGWIKNEKTGVLEKKSKSGTLVLSFSISTGNTPELKAAGELLKEAWGKLGAKVDVLVFETSDLNQNVIRPRKFDALLFGEVVNRNADVYPFWYSKERNDPGLNIALYANSAVDKLLDHVRSVRDADSLDKDARAFDKEIRNDVPAVFLYTPDFIYVVPKEVENINLGKLSTTQDRFQDIRHWYIETHRVWQLFTK